MGKHGCRGFRPKTKVNPREMTGQLLGCQPLSICRLQSARDVTGTVMQSRNLMQSLVDSTVDPFLIIAIHFLSISHHLGWVVRGWAQSRELRPLKPSELEKRRREAG